MHSISLRWLRGNLPLSYHAKSDQDSYQWRQKYISTLLEQDIRKVGVTIPAIRIPATKLRKFLVALTDHHGKIFNASKLGRSLDTSDNTARKYLNIFASISMVRILTPWIENIKKRQVRSPKIYFKDNGILNALLGFSTPTQLHSNPLLGSLWEGFALEQVIAAVQATPEECYFWGTQSEAELDLLIFKNGKRLGFEFKFGDRPSLTKSMHIALKDLKLDHLILVYPGNKIFPMTEDITAYGLDTIAQGTFKYPR